MKWGRPGPFQIIEAEAFELSRAELSSQRHDGSLRITVSSPSSPNSSLNRNSSWSSVGSSSLFPQPQQPSNSPAAPGPLEGHVEPLPEDFARVFTVFRRVVGESIAVSTASHHADADAPPETAEGSSKISGNATLGRSGGASTVEAPRRRYDCPHYGTCLDLAAALDWDNFTCRGCSGEIDEKLLWRAHQALKKDEIARTVCELSRTHIRCVHSKEPAGEESPPDPESLAADPAALRSSTDSSAKRAKKRTLDPSDELPPFKHIPSLKLAGKR